MDFAFSDEQQMLRDQARSFLADRFGTDAVAELAGSDDGWDPGSFRAMAELGWTGLSIPEEQGGADMGFVEEAVLFEELGRSLYPGPYFSTIGLALPALAGDSDMLAAIAGGETTATLAWAEPSGPTSMIDVDALTTKAEKTNGAWTITGEKYLVPDAGLVDSLVVTATFGDGVGLFAVARNEVEVSLDSTMDGTRRLGRVSLAGAQATELVGADRTLDVLGTIRRRALAALALEAVGISQVTLEMSIAHVSERKQFDKPIGTYQAVSHQVVDAYVATELARSLAYWAAWCFEENDEQVEEAVAAAKAAASEAAVGACERAIQVHGGIGFTWESPLHLFYKRAQWIEAFEGYPTKQRAELATHLLGPAN